MKINKKATSIAEAMISMLIIVTWVTWMYKVYISSVRLEESINNKIIAMNIAREWIEAMINIRNTNWIIFSSDTSNCWNTLNYNSLCVWNTTTTNDIIQWTYKIYKDSNDRWKLTSTTSWTYNTLSYRTEHRVWIDSNWFYTQTWTLDNLTPLFTREIKIEYLEDTNWIDAINSNDEKMTVTSLVQWLDNSNNSIHKIELIQILSNWTR